MNAASVRVGQPRAHEHGPRDSPSVLVVRAGALGDVLLLRRAVAGLRRAGREVVLLAPSRSGEVLLGPGGGEATRLVAWDGPDVATLLGGGPPPSALAEELERVEAVIAYTRQADVLAALGGHARQVIAVDPRPGPGTHASAWLASPLAALGVDPAPDPPVLVPRAEEQVRAASLTASLPAGFLAVHPGSGARAKNWPPERFAQLVREWAAGGPWLLVEGPADEPVQALCALPGARRAQDLPARMLGAMLARAGLYVGNDSGVSHLAAAFGAPTLALFGPTDPTVWGPIGPRVTALRSPEGTMASLEVASVLTAAARLASPPRRD